MEGFPAYVEALQHLFARIDSGELRAITSELTLAETLVKPLSLDNAALVQTYSDTLQSSDFLTVAPVSREILIEAARLTAQHTALKLPDALHAATAIAYQATYFISNDVRFRQLPQFATVALGRD